MKRYLVTHPERFNGANPDLTPKGIEQLHELTLPECIIKVVVGTGKRFKKTYDVLSLAGILKRFVPGVFSIFCGSADGLDEGKTIVLADGSECNLVTEYIGLTHFSFNAWGFIGSQPEGTLFCAGGELMTALTGSVGEKGRLYELDIETKTATLMP